MQLKHLAIRQSYFHGLEIYTPNLLSLEISGQVCRDNYFRKNLSSLIYANLDLDFCFARNKYMREHHILKRFLKGLCHTKVFTLGDSSVQVLATWELRKVPAPLSKHKCLMLSTGLQNWEFPGIANLLRSSPDLETLIINISSPFYFSGLIV